jgi:hypothetical protein
MLTCKHHVSILKPSLSNQRRIKRAAIPRGRDSSGTFADRGEHPARALKVLLLFKGLGNTSPDMLKIRYDRTCGQCLLGVMNPRVVFALLFQAEKYTTC